jgi:hypothetical protein
MKKILCGLVMLAAAAIAGAQSTPPLRTIMLSSDGGETFQPDTSSSSVLLGDPAAMPPGFVPMCSSTGLPPFSQCTFGGSGGSFTALSGDAISTATGGATEVVGLLNHLLPSLTTGYLNWNGSAWVFTAGSAIITWPTAGDLLLSTGTGNPSGLAPVNGDCVVGAGGAWTAATCPGGAGTPGGANTDVQYNNASAFGGNSSWTTDGTGDTTQAGVLTATGVTTTGAGPGFIYFGAGTAPTGSPLTGGVTEIGPATATTPYYIQWDPATLPSGSQVPACAVTDTSPETVTCAWSSAATAAFSAIASGTNTTAAMVVAPTATLNWTGSTTAQFGPNITNTNTATGSAGSGYTITTTNGFAQFLKLGTGYTTYKNQHQSDMGIYTNTGNISVLDDAVGGSISLAANSSTTSQFTLTGTLLTLTVPLSGTSISPAAARKGTFVCTAAGTITISNTNELVTSDVVISLNTAAGTISTTPAMKTVTSGTGFTVLCDAADTSTYNYDIYN